jgi:AcrR family transcriptional regulator
MRTKRKLQQAALDLFARNGYDDTTTEEIAEKAGVSPRTFFRYFATKESVLFVGEYLWFERFSAEFMAKPLSMSDPEAMLEALLVTAPGIAKIRRALFIYERATASSATLRGRVADHQQADILRLTEMMETRRGVASPDADHSLTAAVCLLTYRRAVMRWVNGPAAADPADAIREEFALLREMYSTPDRTTTSDGSR